MLTKGIFVKEFHTEKRAEQEDPEWVEHVQLEDDLRMTLNELELALTTPEVNYFYFLF
jgi:hypothetical protein